jgi:hypothetical protein
MAVASGRGRSAYSLTVAATGRKWEGLMQPVVFCLQFTGPLEPVAGVEGVMRPRLSAGALTVATAIGADGATAIFTPGEGAAVTCNSLVTVVGDGRFVESGTFTFGEEGPNLTFKTVREGVVVPEPNSGATAGGILWQITGGTGLYEGANGYISSNFWVDGEGTVRDTMVFTVFRRPA